MNIKRAKEEIKNTIKAYLTKDSHGEYEIPSMRQRPVLLMGPPGIGKTQIMEQVARECQIGLVSYTITHHTLGNLIVYDFKMVSILIFGSMHSNVGFGSQYHLITPFIFLLLSCPQDAEISAPSVRRTVAFTPLSARIFWKL